MSVRRSAVIAGITAACLFSATLASSAPAPGTPARIVDNETVYVVADATGAPRTTVVVDWLQVEGSGSFTIVDPAPGAERVESLTDGFEPSVAGGAVTANVSVNGTGDFFYRADTQAPLPLEVSMAYYLDGERVAPEDLAGRSGRLRIEIALHNTLDRAETLSYAGVGGAAESAEVTYTVPLLCIPQFEIDGTRMKNITPPEGAQLAITGSTRTYAVPMVPSPDASATLEMDATDIELAPLVISVFPKLPASPDFSVAGELDRLREGLGQLEELSLAHVEIVEGIAAGTDEYDLSGATKAAEGIAELQAGLGGMADGADGLASLADGQYAYVDGVIAGIDTSQFDSIGDLLDAIGQLRLAADDLESGVFGLVTLLDGQIAIAEQLRASNAALLAAAQGLAAAYPADPDAAALASGLGAQQAMLDVLLDGGDLGAGTVPGLHYTRAQLADVGAGLTALDAGLTALQTESAALAAVPGAFSDLRAALVALRDGGVVGGQPLPGLGATCAGLDDLADGLGQAEAGLAGSAGDLAMLEDVPTLMADLRAVLAVLGHGGVLEGRDVPGIDTTADALGETAAGLGDGLSDIYEGEALTAAMSAAADAYSSFLGRPEQAEGHLSFLFKLDGVSK